MKKKKSKIEDENFQLRYLVTRILYHKESPILADLKNVTYYWIKIVNFLLTDKIYTSLEIFWKKKEEKNRK